MPNSTCTNILKVCALRVLRLDDVGAIVTGADSMYVTNAPILLGYTPQQPDRERFEQPNGCGDTCGLYLGDDKAVESVNFRLDLCRLDAELIELLAGGTVLTDGAYGTIGYDAPTDATVNANGVAIEAWSLAWNGRSRATLGGSVAWYRHVFPKTKWRFGEVTLQNGFSTIPLTGSGEPNDGFDTGLADDPLPAAIGDTAFRWYLDTAMPSSACGYQAVA